METEQAKEIVTLLANGTDPNTGEVYPTDSPYNDPLVIRALFTLLNNVRIPRKLTKISIEEKRTRNIAAGKPKNAGLPWSNDLRKELAGMFKEGKSVDILADYFERTEGAILSELERQGLIDRNDIQKYG